MNTEETPEENIVTAGTTASEEPESVAVQQMQASTELAALTVTPSERPKIELSKLRYAVVGDDRIEQGERDEIKQHGRMKGSVGRTVRNVNEVLRLDLGLNEWENMSLRSPDAEKAMKLFDDIINDGRAPDVDVIFVHSEQKAFVDLFEQWLAVSPRAQQQYGNVKILFYNEKIAEESPRVIGSVALPARKHVPFGIAVAGILANNGIVELPKQYADIPVKIRADEFNRQAQELLALASAEKPDVKIWDNQALLSSLHSLVNTYRAEQNLPPVELKTEGHHYFVWLVSEFCIHKETAYISHEDLFKIEATRD